MLGFYRRRLRGTAGVTGQSGAVTVVQRASADLRLNPHSIASSSTASSPPRSAPEPASPQNIPVAGPIGTGKTHLAIALRIEAARRRFRVLFTPAADLVRSLLEARDERTLVPGSRQSRSIRHPGIVDVLDFVESAAGPTYLVMELLEGETLAALNSREGPLAPVRAVKLLRRIASPLSAAHARGIVHRDLKPANLFVLAQRSELGEEQLKILDFGIAKLGEANPSITTGTATGIMMGTPLYMAPEQCLDAKRADARADIYALGVIAFEILAKRPPFVSDNLIEVVAMHQAGGLLETAMAETTTRRRQRPTGWPPRVRFLIGVFVVAIVGTTALIFALRDPHRGPSTIAGRDGRLYVEEDELPDGMAWIPTGKYRFGSDPLEDRARYPGEEADNSPRWLNAFAIDRYEYPNEKGELPLVNVSWSEAFKLCEAAGKRLCTEAEFEAACEGPPGHVYPYGDVFDAEACNARGGPDEPVEGGLVPSGERSSCVSPFGVYDLSGNAAEWTSGDWDRKPPGLKVARSGSYTNATRVLRCANRIPKRPETKQPNIGFRCCVSGG